jgi:hypothetical protein
MSRLDSDNKQRIIKDVSDLAARLGFRSADAPAERLIYREFFPRGLTALDNLDEKTLGTRPSLSHLTARTSSSACSTHWDCRSTSAPNGARLHRRNGSPRGTRRSKFTTSLPSDTCRERGAAVCRPESRSPG